MQIGLNLSLRALNASVQFNPASLFAAGEQGAWYDPSDFSTLFQDFAGTTPVTAVGQPVGLMRDKSGRNNHASQATAASRPVLQQDSNGNYFLLCDGVDDGMATSSINFTATDKMTVVAGVRKLSDAAVGMLVELSANLNSNNGTFYMAAPVSVAPNVEYRSKGTLAAAFTDSPFAAPISLVVTGASDIAADQLIIRTNGVQKSSAGDQGTGNYGNYPLFLFRRGGASLPYNGRFYGLIVRGAQSTAQQIAQAETWMNGKTRAY